MEHYYEPTTKVCLRCFITNVEANVFDPPAMCGEGIEPDGEIAETRKKKLIAEGLYYPPPDEPSPED